MRRVFITLLAATLPLPAQAQAQTQAQTQPRAKAQARAAAHAPPPTAAPFDVVEASITDIHAAMASGRLTCRALVEAYLQRIEAYDRNGPGINAIIVTHPRALAIADSLDALRAGVRRGPLHCIPLVVKDNFDTHDLPTTAGSLSMSGFRPARDATQVQRVRAAGAIVLAKANMAEFAFTPYETVSSILPGYTKNPYALDRVTAGSSGGTAAAVAASLGAAGLGTDTGNSIRGPSAHQALVGIRSTMGLTSRAGVVPLNLASDIAGPMARTVADATAIFQVVAGYDPADSVTITARGRTIPRYADALARDGLRGARIGILRQAYERATTDPEVVRVFEHALDDMRREGAVIVDAVRVDSLDARLAAWTAGCNQFRSDFEQYLASHGDRAPVKTVVEVIRSRRFHPSVEKRLEQAQAFEGPLSTAPGCRQRDDFRAWLRTAITRAMDAQRLDALVYPTWSNAPRLIGDLNTPHGDNSQLFSPHTGFPAVTVPMGYLRGGQLPAGITFFGRAWSEATLLRIGYAYERATRHRRAPASAPPLPVTFDSLARASLSRIEGRATLGGLRDSVEVIRDRWGVPHIYARNLDDLFFAQGYVQAQDRLWQMDMYRRTFEGRLAEILGEAYVPHDRLVRLLNFRGPFDDHEWRSYHPEGRRIFDAFAAGVNAFIDEAGDRLPVEFRLTGLRPGRWTAEVALLRTQTAMPTGDAVRELRLARTVAAVGADSANRLSRPSPHRPLVVPAGLDLSVVTPEAIAALSALRTETVRPPLLPQYRAMHDALPSADGDVQEDSPGSNNWVLSGALTASGNVIVANDPHRAVVNPSFRYITHLTAPGWDVIGATEAIMPGVMIGHTGRIAWGLTIVGTDQADVYVEELNRTDHEQVRYRDEWERLRSVVDTIQVKDAAPVVVTHRFSRHGPLFHLDTVRHVAFAMRTTAHLRGSAGYLSALRYHALADCREFLDAQVYYLAPTENMVCGDTRGNIAWQASAASPKRPNWDGRLPVPGTGAYEWDGLRADLPRELNPPRGWIATANHDIHPEGYDPPLFFKAGPQRARFDRLAEVLPRGRKFTLADMAALQHDAHNVAGARDLQLFQGWTSRDAAIEQGRQALAAWDAQHRRESMAAALYHYASRAITDEARAPATTTDARRAVLERAIAAGLDSLRRTMGPDPTAWRWGRINRSELPHALVRAYDIPPVERHGGSGFVAAVGATFRLIVDMGKLDSALATNVPGQSGQPVSPFYRNLVEPYGRGEYFPLVYTRPAVERAAAHRLVLVPVGTAPERSKGGRPD